MGSFIREIKNIIHYFQALFWVFIYAYPASRLRVIGVSGTDGKTTTVNLIYHLLRKSGKKAGVISSIGSLINDEKYDIALHVTTPDPKNIQKSLRLAVRKGCEYFVLEASSHGLDQYRLLGCNFNIGVITNITGDHLDYHKTFDNYAAAKIKMFNTAKIAILNRDDKSYTIATEHLKHKIDNGDIKIITYGLGNNADFTNSNFPFETKLLGRFNLYNCLAAISVASAIGIDNNIIREGITSFSGVIGRMDEINEGQKFRVFIDFASTDNALRAALETLKEYAGHRRLICVFGSAGLRDVGKRERMGEAAGKLADISVVTAEDPRTEDVIEINKQIARGLKKSKAKELDVSDFARINRLKKLKEKYFYRIPDRHEAIKFAIQRLAQKGDVLVFCGKGHEKSMCYGHEERPWDEYGEVRSALKSL